MISDRAGEYLVNLSKETIKYYLDNGKIMVKPTDYPIELDEPLGAVYFDWNEFYNYDAFINSLPYNERVYLLKPRYSPIVNISNTIHFYLQLKMRML